MPEPDRNGRRAFLTALGAGALVPTVSGCDAVVGEVSRRLGADVPSEIEVPDGAAIDPAHHLLSRAAYGPWPGEVERVRKLGAEGWVDEQLRPGSLSDAACDVRTAFIESVHLPADLVGELRPNVVEQQLVTYTLLRAIYSRRQLQEVMVGFFSDHFNIAIGKSLCQFLKPSDDRDVIRRHALGSFRDLLEASAKSAAMLVYLDGRENRRSGPDDVPNENYARELLELHTLGVDGGYTQRDVMEAARCLTGWVVREKWRPGAVEFVPDRHDDGEKSVLGQRIAAGGGAEDLSRLLDILIDHPSCSRFVATKLCRYFVEDDPPRAVVDEAARVFRTTRGQVGPVVRAILLSPEFRASAGRKFKRPFRYVVSTLRALGADTAAREPLVRHLERMGHVPFRYPTPDGHPPAGDVWLGTLLWRWRFALEVAEGRSKGTRVSLRRLRRALGAGPKSVTPWLAHLYGRTPLPSEVQSLSAYLASAEGQAKPERALALALAAPGFQRH